MPTQSSELIGLHCATLQVKPFCVFRDYKILRTQKRFGLPAIRTWPHREVIFMKASGLSLAACSSMLYFSPVATASCPAATPLFPDTRITTEEYRTLVASLKRRPGFACDFFGPQQLRCGDGSGEIWWLTAPGHPAHPAISRTLALADPKTRQPCTARDGYFAGDAPAFAKWMGELKRFDDLAAGHVNSTQK